MRSRSFDADQIMTTALADGCQQHGRRLVYTGGYFDWGDRRIRGELGWEPDYPTARAALPGVVRELTSARG